MPVTLDSAAVNSGWRKLGIVLVPMGALFTARLVCEQTLVPWRRGASRLGFSVFHSWVDVAGVLVVLTAAAWGVAVLVRRVFRRSNSSRTEWTLIAILVTCCGAWMVPYEQWLLLTVRAQRDDCVPNSWIISAAATGQLRLLDYLLSNGVDVDSRGRYGESPLGAAAAAGQLEAARMLLGRRARLESRTDTSRETPLIEAAAANHADMVELLLRHGADAAARDAMARTALDWAQDNRNAGMIAELAMRRN